MLMDCSLRRPSLRLSDRGLFRTQEQPITSAQLTPSFERADDRKLRSIDAERLIAPQFNRLNSKSISDCCSPDMKELHQSSVTSDLSSQDKVTTNKRRIATNLKIFKTDLHRQDIEGSLVTNLGLKSLSLMVLSKVVTSGRISYNEVISDLIVFCSANRLFVPFVNDKSHKFTSLQAVKKRIYEVLKVMIAARLLLKNKTFLTPNFELKYSLACHRIHVAYGSRRALVS